MPTRRDLLKSMAAAPLLPYVEHPDGVVPGRPQIHATAVEFQGYAQPVLVASADGKPFKLEGNPDSAFAAGATDAFTQAACALLYDPRRGRAIRPRGWPEFAAMAAELSGRDLRILTGTVTSPTLARQLADLEKRGARWHVHEPVGLPAEIAASRLAFGRVLDTQWRLKAARAVVCVDADPLGPGPWQARHVRAWAEARRSGETRLFVAEPTVSLTGARADRRLVAAAHRLPLMVAALAAELGIGRHPAGVTDAEAAWVSAAALALAVNSGRSLLAVGGTLPPETIALGHAVNRSVGNSGRTMVHTEPVALVPPDAEDSFATLVRDMAAGQVEALVMLDVNPVYTAPADFGFDKALAQVPIKIHAGLFDDETGALCDWHIPLAHALEEWTDLRAPDGAVTIVQPATDPVLGARRRHEVVAALLGNPAADAHHELRETWRPLLGEPFDPMWRRVLHDGVVPDTQAQPLRLKAAAPPRLPLPVAPQGLELVFRPDPTLWDGRYAPVSWLQELPKPLTKLVWDNIAGLSQALASRLGLQQGDVVEITAGGRSLTAPVMILPFQAEDTVTLYLGHGRILAPPGAAGASAYALRTDEAPWVMAGATLRATGAHQTLATTQSNLRGDLRTIAPGEAIPQKPPPQSLYPRGTSEGPSWAMAIDLDLCTGCNACVVACQAENNIPVVGRSEILTGRFMHWLRVDVIHTGDATLFGPIPCMHCDKAPCELACPVNATVHSPDGLNEMVYARCIGTRTCAAYCPYEVRRFNFFDYANAEPYTFEMLRNPDVSLRPRGVMEKCTYCVQRIRRGSRDNQPFTTACAQACPSRAIAFGDPGDPSSPVARGRTSPRHYAMLDHLGTLPRTTYLARVRDDR